jgi:hypothetical protein
MAENEPFLTRREIPEQALTDQNILHDIGTHLQCLVSNFLRITVYIIPAIAEIGFSKL